MLKIKYPWRDWSVFTFKAGNGHNLVVYANSTVRKTFPEDPKGIASNYNLVIHSVLTNISLSEEFIEARDYLNNYKTSIEAIEQKEWECRGTENMMTDVINKVSKFLVAAISPTLLRYLVITYATNPSTYFVQIKECGAFLISADGKNNI